jgi:hypothetical protein
MQLPLGSGHVYKDVEQAAAEAAVEEMLKKAYESQGLERVHTEYVWIVQLPRGSVQYVLTEFDESYCIRFLNISKFSASISKTHQESRFEELFCCHS